MMNMTKDKSRANPTSKAPRAAKPKATPEELQQAAVLDEINAVTDISVARAKWLQLRQKFEQLNSAKQAAAQAAQAENRLRLAAAEKQDYPAAQVHKEKQDALESNLESVTCDVKRMQAVVGAARERHTELILADTKAPFNRSESVTVYMKRIINPETGDYETVSYLESDQTVQVSLNGKQFESEAYHVDSWASEHGFVVKQTESTVKL